MLEPVEEVRRPGDGELCGHVDERAGQWCALTVFGAELGRHGDREGAVYHVLTEGLASLADRWMLPAWLWFQSPNKDQMVWEFKELTTKGGLKPADFKAPGFPDKEWKAQWMKPPAPTVTRTSAPGK